MLFPFLRDFFWGTNPFWTTLSSNPFVKDFISAKLCFKDFFLFFLLKTAKSTFLGASPYFKDFLVYNSLLEGPFFFSKPVLQWLFWVQTPNFKVFFSTNCFGGAAKATLGWDENENSVWMVLQGTGIIWWKEKGF